MRVLVTGASGLLGRSVARALVERGDDVTVMQRRPAGVPSAREVLGDIADVDAVHAAADGQDAVVHLAAKVHVAGRWADYERTNVDGTRNVVEACHSAGVARLVHVSSPSVAHVGEPLVGVDASAADPVRARGSYALSKAQAEVLALASDGPGLSVVAVRPHLVWGPGDPQLVERIVSRARSHRLALVGSGAALIDTTYIDNAVYALVAALDRCHDAHGQALVVSNGEPRTVAELVTAICRAAGVPQPRLHVPAPLARGGGAVVERLWALVGAAGDPPVTSFLAEQLSTAHWFDQRRTRELLRWRPHVSIDEGLARLSEAFGRTA
jgi:nucleoside-diphosphate-sugar epimerase